MIVLSQTKINDVTVDDINELTKYFNDVVANSSNNIRFSHFKIQSYGELTKLADFYNFVVSGKILDKELMTAFAKLNKIAKASDYVDYKSIYLNDNPPEYITLPTASYGGNNAADRDDELIFTFISKHCYSLINSSVYKRFNEHSCSSTIINEYGLIPYKIFEAGINQLVEYYKYGGSVNFSSNYDFDNLAKIMEFVDVSTLPDDLLEIANNNPEYIETLVEDPKTGKAILQRVRANVAYMLVLYSLRKAKVNPFKKLSISYKPNMLSTDIGRTGTKYLTIDQFNYVFGDSMSSEKYNNLITEFFFDENIDIEERKKILKQTYKLKNIHLYRKLLGDSSMKTISAFIDVTILQNNRVPNKDVRIAELIWDLIYSEKVAVMSDTDTVAVELLKKYSVNILRGMFGRQPDGSLNVVEKRHINFSEANVLFLKLASDPKSNIFSQQFIKQNPILKDALVEFVYTDFIPSIPEESTSRNGHSNSNVFESCDKIIRMFLNVGSNTEEDSMKVLESNIDFLISLIKSPFPEKSYSEQYCKYYEKPVEDYSKQAKRVLNTIDVSQQNLVESILAWLVGINAKKDGNYYSLYKKIIKSLNENLVITEKDLESDLQTPLLAVNFISNKRLFYLNHISTELANNYHKLLINKLEDVVSNEMTFINTTYEKGEAANWNIGEVPKPQLFSSYGFRFISAGHCYSEAMNLRKVGNTEEQLYYNIPEFMDFYVKTNKSYYDTLKNMFADDSSDYWVNIPQVAFITAQMYKNRNENYGYNYSYERCEQYHSLKKQFVEMEVLKYDAFLSFRNEDAEELEKIQQNNTELWQTLIDDSVKLTF